MYDLQKILLDNYCKKYAINVVSTERTKEGVLIYYLNPRFENGEIVSYPTLNAYHIFPERFGIINEDCDSGIWLKHSN